MFIDISRKTGIIFETLKPGLSGVSLRKINKKFPTVSQSNLRGPEEEK